MPGRRRRIRQIGFEPGYLCFKPCGRPGRGMPTLVLRLDELEALRLADLEGLYQEACAGRMGISRTTFSRTLSQARGKLTDALLNGKRLVVENFPGLASDMALEHGATGREPDASSSINGGITTPVASLSGADGSTIPARNDEYPGGRARDIEKPNDEEDRLDSK